MTLLHIPVSDELKARLAACAAEGGFGTIEQFAQAVLEATAEPELTDEQVEELLVRRLEDPRPDIELTPAFKEQFMEEVRKRRESDGPKS
jgi:hypothetical protein